MRYFKPGLGCRQVLAGFGLVKISAADFCMDIDRHWLLLKQGEILKQIIL